jgi:hypothetical protein
MTCEYFRSVPHFFLPSPELTRCLPMLTAAQARTAPPSAPSLSSSLMSPPASSSTPAFQASQPSTLPESLKSLSSRSNSEKRRSRLSKRTSSFGRRLRNPPNLSHLRPSSRRIGRSANSSVSCIGSSKRGQIWRRSSRRKRRNRRDASLTPSNHSKPP